MADEHKEKAQFGSLLNSPVQGEKSFFIPFVILLLLNIAVFIYAASNIAVVHENQKKIVKIDRTLATLKGDGENARRGYVSREAFDALANRVTELEKALSVDRTGWLDDDAERLMLSAPGMYATQRLQPPPASSLEQLLAPGQGSADAAAAPTGDLPRYERRISPDGKLILRKLR